MRRPKHVNNNVLGCLLIASTYGSCVAGSSLQLLPEFRRVSILHGSMSNTILCFALAIVLQPESITNSISALTVIFFRGSKHLTKPA